MLGTGNIPDESRPVSLPPLAVTIATQRSGTKFLVSALNAGSLVRAHGEVLKHDAPPPSLKSFLRSWLPAQPDFAFRVEDMTRLLDDFAAEVAAAAAPRLAHLDVMYNNLGGLVPVWTWPTGTPQRNFLCRWLRQREVAVIHLVRENVAECFASDQIARARGVFHTREAAAPAPEIRLAPSLAEARAYMTQVLQSRALVRAAFRGYGRYLELRYPDFIAGDGLAPEAVASLGTLLGLDPARLAGRSTMQRTAPDKAALVENYAEIEALWRELAAA